MCLGAAIDTVTYFLRRWRLEWNEREMIIQKKFGENVTDRVEVDEDSLKWQYLFMQRYYSPGKSSK